MVWLFLAAVTLLIAALALRAKSPGRAIAVAAIALLTGLGALVFLLAEQDTPPAVIAAEELTLADVVLSSDRYGHQLSGRVTNRSARRLGTLALTITFKECPAQTPCRELGKETVRLFLALPPGQTGGFSALLSQGALADRASVSWDCAVTGANADF